MSAFSLSILFNTFCSSITIRNTCTRKFINGPFKGYHCNTEYYANLTNFPRHRCTDLCVKALQCLVLSYNPESQQCLMGAESCAATEAHPHSLLMVFREKEDEPCVSWITPPSDPTVSSRLVETQQHHLPFAAVGRKMG